MTNSCRLTLERCEDRCLPTASPLVSQAYLCVNKAMSNYYSLANAVAYVQSQLSARGVSSLHEVLQERLTASQRKLALAAEANLTALENKYYRSEAACETNMTRLRNLEATKYKKYDHTAFNQDLATFNAYDKAFWSEMIALETMM